MAVGFRRGLLITLCAVISVLIFGTLGYRTLYPDSEPFDAFYMTVITITTVGFNEVFELDQAGKLFTAVLILLGWSVLTLALAVITSNIVSGKLTTVFGRKKVKRQIEKIKDHYIVCGFGRMGAIVSNQLANGSVPFVVVESDVASCEKLDLNEMLFIQGDAGDEDVLRRAGIERARGVVAAVGSDAENVFICLTARQMNQRLFILARSLDEAAERKLRAAGANIVISPYSIGGMRMANAILRPHVVDLLDLAMFSEEMDVLMEQITLPEGSSMVEKTLKQSNIHIDYGLIIIGIRRADGRFHFNPSGNTRLEAGDTLITMGPHGDLKRLENHL
ncbi:MAG: potassium channel protein [Candidatus Alcyoniella australis]|nr:potassium channel protein [Candidatus Alcyoniella australis]